MIVEAIYLKTGQVVRVVDSYNRMHSCTEGVCAPVKQIKVIRIRCEDNEERQRKGLKTY